MNRANAIKDKCDLQRMVNFLKQNKPKYYVIFLLALNSGLRISDVLNLDIEDVEGKEIIEIHEKKTGKYKRFPINKTMQNVIKKYLVERKKQYCVCEGNPLFVGKKHCRIERSQCYRVFRNTAEILGIEGTISCHSPRKTFGYCHYKQYNDIGLLQTILQHSSPAITLRYIDVTQEEVDNSYLHLDFGIEV